MRNGEEKADYFSNGIRVIRTIRRRIFLSANGADETNCSASCIRIIRIIRRRVFLPADGADETNIPVPLPSQASKGLPEGIVINLFRFRKSLTRLFPTTICSTKYSCPICLIRPIKILTRPDRPCKTATLRSPLGPDDNAKEALSESRWGRTATHNWLEKPPLGGWGSLREVFWGACWGLFNKKRKHFRTPFPTAKVQQKKAKCKSEQKISDNHRATDSHRPPTLSEVREAARRSHPCRATKTEGLLKSVIFTPLREKTDAKEIQL
ncbi:hypothetical protein HMPREF6485_2688 [Segatella buccae ATCC 33574]|uniref:Uncharacterized protein n=1 Tax=Segatella buccae ATCC 33574 TaxID=873513 RepID=E6KAQ2_9BACT|nr:hypothetical protein HMPREF6485_2688 [Segatella buccae ATCC 33574]